MQISIPAIGFFTLLLLASVSFAQSDNLQCRATCCNEADGQWIPEYNGVCSWPGGTAQDVRPDIYSKCIKDKCTPPSMCTLSFILPAFVGIVFFLDKSGDLMKKRG